MSQNQENLQTQRGHLAIFDFDGTSISGNSPVTLVKYLAGKKMLRLSFLVRFLAWGIAYAWHLPQNEEWARSLVFSAFEGKQQHEVDAFLHEFYDVRIEPMYRVKADEAMRRHRELGHTVVVVSATFEPIVLRAMQFHEFSHQISVRMKVDKNACYTREVEGKAVEGKEKVRRIQAFGDAMFGVGNWDVECAYADHYSDIPLLECAKHPIAVSPSPALARHAKKCGWEVLDW